MALPKLPSVEDVLENPDIILSLPTPQAMAILQKLQEFDRTIIPAEDFGYSPIEMALKIPRFKWMDTRHIRYISDVVDETILNHESTIVVVPPQHAKSHTCSVWAPISYLRRHPDRFVVLVSYEKNFARKWGRQVRDLIMQHGPEWGLELDPRQMAADDWALLSGGGMKTTGLDGSISGRYIGLFIIDDAIKNYEEAHSEVIRENTWDWWEGTALQRIQPDTSTIVIGTRWHEDDLIGRLLKSSKDGTGRHFKLVTLSAIAGSDDPLGRAPGEGLWLDGSAPKGQAFYDLRRAEMSEYKFSAIYQGLPTMPGGNTIDPDWWQWYSPSSKPVLTKEIITVDLALDSKKKVDSYQAALEGGIYGPNLIVQDGFYGHMGYMKAQDQVRQLSLTYPAARQKVVERSVTGPALVGTLNTEIGGFILWPPKGEQKASKEVNVDACQPFIRSGNVWLPLTPNHTKPKWAQELVLECQQFPRGSHDDLVDCLTLMMLFLMPTLRIAARERVNDFLKRFKQNIETLKDRQTAKMHDVMRQVARSKAAAYNKTGPMMNVATIEEVVAGKTIKPHSSGLQPFGPGPGTGPRPGIRGFAAQALGLAARNRKMW